jgi:hypothetical protein
VPELLIEHALIFAVMSDQNLQPADMKGENMNLLLLYCEGSASPSLYFQVCWSRLGTNVQFKESWIHLLFVYHDAHSIMMLLI